MILFYVDESGTGLGDKRSPYFTLGSISFPVQMWAMVDHEITALKRRLVRWAKPEDWEIKGRDLRRGEHFFKGQDWQTRAAAIVEIAEILANLPCQIYAVQVDKRDLPRFVETPADLHRLAFWRLLDALDDALTAADEQGMLMMDMQSNMHTSVQDRRTLDAFKEWAGQRSHPSRFVELPWFGFSAFYAGLQLADFVSYVIDFGSHEAEGIGRTELGTALEHLGRKVRLLRIP